MCLLGVYNVLSFSLVGSDCMDNKVVDHNASAKLFGWHFQIYAGIVLMLDNIKDAHSLRIEGKDEDVELIMCTKEKIYAQVKGFNDPQDTRNVKRQLNKALASLNDAASKSKYIALYYITNSSNPFNEKNPGYYYNGMKQYFYRELPVKARDTITSIIASNDFSEIDANRLMLKIIPFYGEEEDTRLRDIKYAVVERFGRMNVQITSIITRVMYYWLAYCFHNGTIRNTSVYVSKEKFVWPVICSLLEKCPSLEYKSDLSLDEQYLVEEKYKTIIDNQTMDYEFVIKVITDFNIFKKGTKRFVEEKWSDYKDFFSCIDGLNDNHLMILIKIILSKILLEAKEINDLKVGVGL